VSAVVAEAGADTPPPPPPVDWSQVQVVPMFSTLDVGMLEQLAAAKLLDGQVLLRDTVVPRGGDGAVCVVATGQVSLAVFDRVELEARLAERQRDATLGQEDGTLMPPPPLARVAKRNLALFAAGDAFNPGRLPPAAGNEVVVPFALGRTTVVTIERDALARIGARVPALSQALGSTLGHTAARLKQVTGVKQEILDFYLRHGMSVAGPSVRIRQLDLCIDCKQCEEACEERHGARRLTLGGFELGMLDFVFSCRTCADARCLSPCEHDAIKRDASTGEIKILEDKCIGCSLCSLSCPYGAIDMVNVAEPDSPNYKLDFKARLEKGGRLAFGAGKGRKAPARRIANKCDHCEGYGEQACVSACPTGSLIELSPATLFRERLPDPTTAVLHGRKRPTELLPVSPFIHGVGVKDSGEARVRTRKLSRLVWMIGLLPFLAVLAEILVRVYAPTYSVSYRMAIRGGLEHEIASLNVGYLGTALMVLSMAYVLQRRFGWFHKTATNQFWLEVHLMTGTVGPLFIALHSALRLTTWVSIPFWAMVMVVLSGVLGRYLYTLVPGMTSKHDLEILKNRRSISSHAAAHPQAAALAQKIVDQEAERSNRVWEVGLTTLLLWIMADDLRRGWQMRGHRRALRKLAPRAVARDLARSCDRVTFFERRKVIAPRGKTILRSWKRVHIPFSIVLLLTMGLHIYIALV